LIEMISRTEAELLLVDLGGRTDLQSWGTVLATVARRYGLTGAIVNGATRDVTGLAEMSFPTFARGVAPATNNGRLELVGANRPVTLDGDVVEAGWMGAADANGVVFFRRTRRRFSPGAAPGRGREPAARRDPGGRRSHRHAARGPGGIRMKEPLANQRHLFEIPDGVAFFNCANLAPQLRSVRKAGERALARNARPWETASSDWFTDVERLRTLFARLVGGDADGSRSLAVDQLRAAVAALNLDARPARASSRSHRDFPSAVYTWRSFARRRTEVRTVAREANQSWTEALLAAIDERVSVVAVPNVQWTDGSLVNLQAIAERARSVGAVVAIDATQSLGAMPLDVRALDPDFVVAAGYKWLLGPFGLGYLYVAERHRDGRPLEENWILRAGSDDFARLTDYRDDYQAGARRFDVGERTLHVSTRGDRRARAAARLASRPNRGALALHAGRIERGRKPGPRASSRGRARAAHARIRVPEAPRPRTDARCAEFTSACARGSSASLLTSTPAGADIDLLLDALAGQVEWRTERGSFSAIPQAPRRR
jgi:hypothetical protein